MAGHKAGEVSCDTILCFIGQAMQEARERKREGTKEGWLGIK